MHNVLSREMILVPSSVPDQKSIHPRKQRRHLEVFGRDALWRHLRTPDSAVGKEMLNAVVDQIVFKNEWMGLEVRLVVGFLGGQETREIVCRFFRV
jgi:hypothetical protein